MKIEIDKKLIRKYDVRGPRYTSYPTVPNFSDRFCADDFLNAVGNSEYSRLNGDISVYVHIPYCRSKCFYCGCTSETLISPAKNDIYIDHLSREFSLLAPLLRGRKLVQLHLGGGTPNVLTPEQMRRLMQRLCEYFDFDDSAEIGTETDPRLLSQDYIDLLRDLGFNRISMGVQDFNPEVQKKINRFNSFADIAHLREYCKNAGFASVNFDIIYGLPGQTPDSFRKTLGQVAEIAPDRIAVYNFAYLPQLLKNQKMISPEDIPEAYQKLDMLTDSIRLLKSAGYEYIGMDHFALPGDDLTRALRNGSLRRNFQGYATKAGSEVFAFGVSAISQLENAFAQNAKNTAEYISGLDERKPPVIKGYALSRDDKIRREVISRIMCDGMIEKEDINSGFGIDFDEYFAREIELLDEFIDDGLIIKSAGSIEITESGRLVLRNIAMAFDKYIEADKGKNLYSRTV
jgi:oxygen-independent coproporphyrinogen-3 oxidase